MRAVRAITLNELRLLRADPYPFVLLVLMPLGFLAFVSDGLVGGPGQSVPGILTLFAFLGLYNVGLAFFREHGWGTWERLRMLPVTMPQIMVGKIAPLVGMYLVQSTVLLLAGYWFFGMPMNGAAATLVVVVLVVIAAMSALGLLLVAFCRTMNQVAAAANVGGLVLAGLGGALAPVSSFPGWAQALARISPVYWALLALRGVMIEGDSLSEVAGPLVVLLAIAVVAATLGLVRFDSTQVKESYS